MAGGSTASENILDDPSVQSWRLLQRYLWLGQTFFFARFGSQLWNILFSFECQLLFATEMSQVSSAFFLSVLLWQTGKTPVHAYLLHVYTCLGDCAERLAACFSSGKRDVCIYGDSLTSCISGGSFFSVLIYPVQQLWASCEAKWGGGDWGVNKEPHFLTLPICALTWYTNHVNRSVAVRYTCHPFCHVPLILKCFAELALRSLGVRARWRQKCSLKYSTCVGSWDLINGIRKVGGPKDLSPTKHELICTPPSPTIVGNSPKQHFFIFCVCVCVRWKTWVRCFFAWLCVVGRVVECCFWSDLNQVFDLTFFVQICSQIVFFTNASDWYFIQD